MPRKPSDPSNSSTERRRTKVAKAGPTAVAAPEAATVDSAANFIQFGSGQGGRGPENTVVIADKLGNKSREREERAGAKAGDRPSRSSTRAPRVPDSVQERFIQIGNKFHFPDGAEAFTHQGNRLTTRSENAVVIQSMVAIAREHSAGPITVGGTEFFRKEAWFAAGLVGLEVQGYAPTEFERERLARAIGARRGAPQPDTRSAPREAESVGQTERAAAPRSPDSELIVGRLVDHGPAPYAHDPKQPMSYFVRIETERGDRNIWGVDLERAFRHSLSTPGIGDEVGLRAIGKAAVTVLTAKRDAEGREVGREPLDTHRNQWIVERKSFLDERRKMADVLRDPAIGANDAIKRHPELEGSYLQLQMGRALADKQYGSKAQREQFVEHLRAHLAQRIEFGQPLEPVLLRGGEERTAEPRSPDRDYSPTR